ncbi:MAG: aspartyl protease family protein [Bacteroidaceae bacterium]|nr:aspartyl protease family protein [Bacteroidaceae bacterium]
MTYSKRIAMCLLACICYLSAFAQQEQYQTQLNMIKQAFDNKDIALLDGMIADSCTILSKSGNLLLPSLKAIYATLANNTIDCMTLVSSEPTANGGTRLTYNINYSVLGEKDACFAFDENGKIIQLDYLAGAKSQTVKKVSAKKSAIPFISIPFLLDKNHLVVIKGQINGKECNLIWDSGAKRSILNSDYFTNSEFESGTANLGGVNAKSATGVAVADSITLNVSSITVENGTFLTKSLKHLEANAEEMPIAGLLGMDILGGYDIIYDYDTKKLTLIDSQAQIRLQGNPIATIPYSQFASDYLPCIKVNIDGKEVELGIDCGAGANLIHKSALPKGIQFDTAHLAGISGDITKQQFGNMNFTIGDVSFEDQPFVVGDISHLNLGIDGLLGYPFLSSHKMMFKNSTKELIIF